jgi:hypothetical protein
MFAERSSICLRQQDHATAIRSLGNEVSTLDIWGETHLISLAQLRCCMHSIPVSTLLLFAVVLRSTSGLAAEQTASARLWCESLHFSQGHFAGDTLDLSTIEGVPNGELAPYDGESLVSTFILDYSGMPIFGNILVGVPAFADNDGDGFHDFYESSQPVYTTTSGTYRTAVSTGTVTATWNRGSNSKDGNCVLNLVDSIYGALGQFSHTFELLEYAGPILYSGGKTTVSNRFVLTQTGSSEQQFTGRFVLTKNAADRFNSLQFPSGIWTNTTFGDLRVLETVIVRENPWPTNYYGYIDFEDGDPRTAVPDYQYWTLSIDDLNDSNKNGIPDFSDDPAIRAPSLAISLNAGSLKLQIEGEIGRTHLIQESSSLLLGFWQTVSSVLLTNDSQAISLPLPQTDRFWRIIAQ